MEAYEVGTMLGQGMMMGVIVTLIILAVFLFTAIVTAIMSVSIHSELKKLNSKLGKIMYAKEISDTNNFQHRNTIEDIDYHS